MIIPWNFTGCYSIEEWKKIIEDWEKSGLKKATYCRIKRIPYNNFYRWYNKIYPSNSLSFGEIKERWKRIVKDWEKSGLSKHAYCKAKGLSCSMFFLRENEFNPHISRKTSHMEAVERWTPIVEDWKRSGLSKFSYCKKHGLAYSTFLKWTKTFDSFKIPHLSANLIEESYIETPLQNHVDPIPPNPTIAMESVLANQKIKVLLSQGEHFFLEGPFDWPKLTAWLTPLLTR